MSLTSWLCKKKKNVSSNNSLLCSLSHLVLEVELLKPTLEFEQCGNGFEDDWDRRLEEMNKEWGPVVSHYLNCHWECVLYYKSLTALSDPPSTNPLSSSPVTLCRTNTVQLAKICTSSLDASSSDAIVTVCKCLTLLVPEVPNYK